MITNTSPENDRKAGQHIMKSPPFVSPQEWETAREQLLAKEKAFARARDALAAERRRMPWVAVEKAYMFDGPEGKASLLDLFEGQACTAGRSMHALAVLWEPTKSVTLPI